MRRRDFGVAALAGLGMATVGRIGDAQAADTLVTAKDPKIKAVKGSDAKFYLVPSGTIDLKPGAQVQFQYVGLQDEKPTFKLVEVKAGSGEVTLPLGITGAPSTSFDATPKNAQLIMKGSTVPIVVEQPGS